MMKQLGIPLVWILLSGALIAPIASLPVFAVDATTTTLVSSQNPSALGQPITFTATVTPSNATGIVIFNDTSTSPPTILSMSVLSGGTATFSTSSLSTGSHTVVAKYLGDTKNVPSTSNVITQTVNSTSASQGVIMGKVSGNGNLGKGNNFEFNVDSKNGTTFKGHLNYHDKTAHFDLHSKRITSFSVDNSMTNIVITGQAKTKGNPDNATQLMFSVSITLSDKKGKHDQFSITVTDSSGKVVYQKSGTANGHVEFHKLKVKSDHHDKNEKKDNKKVNHKNNVKNNQKDNENDD